MTAGANLFWRHLSSLDPDLRGRIRQAGEEIGWIRLASAEDLLGRACDALGIKPVGHVFESMTAVDLGNLSRAEILSEIDGHFEPGTSTAGDLADQIQLCRAFDNPGAVTKYIESSLTTAIEKFPSSADDLKVGHNPGDVLDPFILAANYELLSQRSVQKTIESSTAHKVLMKVEDLVGNLHQNVIGMMRGNFRVPEPQGTSAKGKENLDGKLHPFPGADVGQVPVPDRPDVIRLFQVKSKTGSAKGGDGKRLGEQLHLLESVYQADTFYVSIVGNTLRGHRSRGAVQRESSNTAVLVGESALDALTQSKVGGELLLRTYQRSFRRAAQTTGYDFDEIVASMCEIFEQEARDAGEDFLTAWLHEAIGGEQREQDSRLGPLPRRRKRETLE